MKFCENYKKFPCKFKVCTRYEMEILQANSKESDKLYNHLMEQTRSKQWKKAIESRNKLLATDQMGYSYYFVFGLRTSYLF